MGDCGLAQPHQPQLAAGGCGRRAFRRHRADARVERGRTVGIAPRIVAGVPAVGADAFGQYLGFARYDGGGAVCVAGEAAACLFPAPSRPAARVGFGGGVCGRAVLRAACRFFRADAAQCFDVGGVRVGVAQGKTVGVGDVVAGVGGGAAVRPFGGFGCRYLAVFRFGGGPDMGVCRAFVRGETANRRARAVGGFGVVSGFARLSVCLAAFGQPFGQCGVDTVVFLGVDPAGVAGFGRAVCAASAGGAFLAEYTLRFLVWLADVSPEFAVAAAPLPLLVLAVCAALLLLLPRGLGLRPWAVLLLAGFVSYRPEAVPENEAAVTVWDAGQGLSVLVRTANRHLLFDTGTVAAAQTGIVPSLNAAGVRRLDKLVLSHHDSDHDGGFQAVGKIPNGGIYAGQPEFYEGARHCAEQRWQWDGVDFEFLRPSERKNIDDNGKSCVLRVVAGGAALLVTGDLDTKGEESLVGKYGGNLYSQVLVLGHHGSNTSSSGVFLNAVSPEYAVASSGYANAYKHPTEAVQNRVRAHGIKLLRTDLSGALQFGLGRGGVKAQRLRVYKFYWQKKPFE